jgi:hypothetical protein
MAKQPHAEAEMSLQSGQTLRAETMQQKFREQALDHKARSDPYIVNRGEYGMTKMGNNALLVHKYYCDLLKNIKMDALVGAVPMFASDVSMDDVKCPMIDLGDSPHFIPNGEVAYLQDAILMNVRMRYGRQTDVVVRTPISKKNTPYTWVFPDYVGVNCKVYFIPKKESSSSSSSSSSLHLPPSSSVLAQITTTTTTATATQHPPPPASPSRTAKEQLINDLSDQA